MKYLSIALLFVFLSYNMSNAKIITFNSEQEVKKIKTSIDSYFKNYPPTYRKRIKNYWYGVYVRGVKTGWMHGRVEKIIHNNETYYLTRTSMFMSMKKASTTVMMVGKIEMLEDSKGDTVLFFNYNKEGKAVKIIQGRGDKNNLTWSINNGMTTVHKQRKLKRKLAGSYKIDRWIKNNCYKQGLTKKMLAFSSTFPEKDTSLSITMQKAETVDILGEKKKLIKVKTVMDMGMPVSVNMWVNSKGVDYKVEGMGIINWYRMPKVMALKDDRFLDMTTILKK